MRQRKVSKWYLVALTIGALGINLVVVSYAWVKVFGLQGATVSQVAPALVLLLAVMPYALGWTLYEESFFRLWAEEDTKSLRVQLVVINLISAFLMAFIGCIYFASELRDRRLM